MKEPQGVRDVIREAYAIAETVPAMIVEELRHGWVVCFKDNDYRAEPTSANDLLREVKEARDFYEVWCKETAKKRDEEEKKHYVRLEKEVKVVRDEGEVVRVDGLERDTKVLLLDFIEGLTIKEVSEIIGKDYPCSVWDELHFIREKLRDSLEVQGGQRG